MQARADFAIIGGGIVGLATALALGERRPGATITVIEKEDGPGLHQTGHNSGVIHAGVYYQPGSLKARFCREGVAATIAFAKAHDIPVDQCGKLVVATAAEELGRLDALEARCRENGLDPERLDAGALRAAEPNIAGLAAIRVAATGITDYPAIARAMAAVITARGGRVLTGRAVTGIAEGQEGVTLTLAGGESLGAGRLIACAGLQADRVARFAGLDPGLRIVPFRGEYYRLNARLNGVVRQLIYPVPDPALPFLGVHLTRMIDGSVTVGPNAVLGLAREGYPRFSVDLRDTAATLSWPGFWRLAGRHWRSGLAEMKGSLSRRAYLALCRRYCPGLTLADLEPCPAGIRAQAVMADGTLLHDFLIRETGRGVHVLNAPSPAATSAIPIGAHVADLALKAG